MSKADAFLREIQIDTVLRVLAMLENNLYLHHADALREVHLESDVAERLRVLRHRLHGKNPDSLAARSAREPSVGVLGVPGEEPR